MQLRNIIKDLRILAACSALIIGLASPVHTAYALKAGTSTSTTSVVADESALTVQLSASRQRVEPERTFTYTLRINNPTGQTIENVDVELSLDRDLKSRSASNGGRNGKWNDLTIPPGGLTLTATAEVSSSAEENDFLNAVALVGGSFSEVEIEVEDDEANDNDDDRKIEVFLSAEKQIVEPDSKVKYQAHIINKTDKNINDTQILLMLDDNVEFISASNGGKLRENNTVVWDDIDVRKHKTRKLRISARVKDDAEHDDKIEAMLSSEGSVHEYVQRVSAPFDGYEFVQMDIFENDDPSFPGAEITYNLRVRNLHDEDERVTVYALLDPRLDFVSATEDGMQVRENVVEWEDIPLKQNGKKKFKMTVKVKEGLTQDVILKTNFYAGQDRQQIPTRVIMNHPEMTKNTATGSSRSIFGSRSFFGTSDENDTDASEETSSLPEKIQNEWAKLFGQHEIVPSSQTRGTPLVIAELNNADAWQSGHTVASNAPADVYSSDVMAYNVSRSYEKAQPSFIGIPRAKAKSEYTKAATSSTRVPETPLSLWLAVITIGLLCGVVIARAALK